MASNKRLREQEQEDQVAEEKQVQEQEQEPTVACTKRPRVQEQEDQVQSELYLCFTSVGGPQERLRSVAVSDLIAETKSCSADSSDDDEADLTLETIKKWVKEWEKCGDEPNYENGDDPFDAAEEAFQKLVKAGKSFELAVHPPSFVLNVLREY